MHHAHEEFVSATVEKRLDKKVKWQKGSTQDPKVTSRINALLKHELTSDAAVQIALFNNPHIQAVYEEIGVSQADLVEAGLFSNPAFDIFIRYPTNKKHEKADVEYSLTSSFINIFLIPLRVKVAQAELEQTTRRVTNEILDLAFTVAETFYALQAEEQELRYMQSIVELADIQEEIAKRQKEAGNINSLAYNQVDAQFVTQELESRIMQNNITRLREKLHKLLGLKENVHWTIAGEFPEVDYEGLPLHCLTAIAFKERLDLQAARFDVLRLSQSLGIKQWWVYSEGRLGLAGERDPNGLNTLGPAFSFEIPLINYGQAAKKRLLAELRQAQDHLAALEISITSEVREAHKLLMNSVHIIHEYKARALPSQRKIVESSEELYNVMGLGIDQLLESKEHELEVQRKFVMAIREYWLARVQLDRALGGNLHKIYSDEGED